MAVARLRLRQRRWPKLKEELKGEMELLYWNSVLVIDV
jgi:hypothetical protein